MIPQNPRQNIYGPKTLAVMDQAFVAIWQVLRADDPSATTTTIASSLAIGQS